MAWHEHTWRGKCCAFGSPASTTFASPVPLQDGQQILAVLQSQLAEVDQVLLSEGAQNGPSNFTLQGLMGLQGGHSPRRLHGGSCSMESKHAYPKFGTGRGGTTTENRQCKTSQVGQSAYL